MKKEFKKELERIVAVFPSSRVLLAIVVAIILGVILYISILFGMSR